MKARKQNIDTLSDQSALRVEPEVMIGMQTFMGITENHLTAFKPEKDGLLEYILSLSLESEPCLSIIGIMKASPNLFAPSPRRGFSFPII